MIKKLLCLVGMLLSVEASALISVEGSYGLVGASLSEQDSDHSGSSFRGALHLDPIPLVPVSFGLALSSLELDDDGEKLGGGGFFLGLEVKAWIPFVPVVTPYGRLSYVPYGLLTQSGSTESGSNTFPFESAYDLDGILYAVGIDWQPLPLLSLFLEYQMGTLTGTPSEVKVNNEDVTSGTNATDVDLGIFYLGVSVGI